MKRCKPFVAVGKRIANTAPFNVKDFIKEYFKAKPEEEIKNKLTGKGVIWYNSKNGYSCSLFVGHIIKEEFSKFPEIEFPLSNYYVETGTDFAVYVGEQASDYEVENARTYLCSEFKDEIGYEIGSKNEFHEVFDFDKEGNRRNIEVYALIEPGSTSEDFNKIEYNWPTIKKIEGVSGDVKLKYLGYLKDYRGNKEFIAFSYKDRCGILTMELTGLHYTFLCSSEFDVLNNLLNLGIDSEFDKALDYKLYPAELDRELNLNQLYNIYETAIKLIKPLEENKQKDKSLSSSLS